MSSKDQVSTEPFVTVTAGQLQRLNQSGSELAELQTELAETEAARVAAVDRERNTAALLEAASAEVRALREFVTHVAASVVLEDQEFWNRALILGRAICATEDEAQAFVADLQGAITSASHYSWAASWMPPPEPDNPIHLRFAAVIVANAFDRLRSGDTPVENLLHREADRIERERNTRDERERVIETVARAIAAADGHDDVDALSNQMKTRYRHRAKALADAGLLHGLQ